MKTLLSLSREIDIQMIKIEEHCRKTGIKIHYRNIDGRNTKIIHDADAIKIYRNVLELTRQKRYIHGKTNRDEGMYPRITKQWEINTFQGKL